MPRRGATGRDQRRGVIGGAAAVVGGVVPDVALVPVGGAGRLVDPERGDDDCADLRRLAQEAGEGLGLAGLVLPALLLDAEERPEARVGVVVAADAERLGRGEDRGAQRIGVAVAGEDEGRRRALGAAAARGVSGSG